MFTPLSDADYELLFHLFHAASSSYQTPAEQGEALGLLCDRLEDLGHPVGETLGSRLTAAMFILEHEFHMELLPF